jgi:hypothetical protein
MSMWRMRRITGFRLQASGFRKATATDHAMAGVDLCLTGRLYREQDALPEA